VRKTNENMSEQEILLEQYKLYVEMADRVSSRRVQTHKFYTTLLTALLAILSLATDKSIFTTNQVPVCFIVSVLGIVLNVIWLMNIRSYKHLNTGKFMVIHEMEQDLPFQCYDKEWKHIGEGHEIKKYIPLTIIEQIIPLLLAIPYLILFVYSIFNFFKN